MKARILVVFTAFIALVFTGIFYYTYYSPYLISSSNAKKLLQERKIDVILDVRTDLEYNLGHYPGALHIPTKKLSDQVASAIPNKETSILVYCNTGQRSRYATDLLRAKGYKNVRYISGPYWTLLR
jgi:rhodanese-related sulfurtransferase